MDGLAPDFTQVLLQSSSTTQTTLPINKLAIVMDLSWQLGTVQNIVLRTDLAHQEPTKVFPKLSQRWPCRLHPLGVPRRCVCAMEVYVCDGGACVCVCDGGVCVVCVMEVRVCVYAMEVCVCVCVCMCLQWGCVCVYVSAMEVCVCVCV